MSEKKDTNVWNSTRILYGYLHYSDDDGCLPNIVDWKNSSNKIYHQRFYAALRAYGKNPEWFYRSEALWPENREICRRLLSNNRSKEKKNEFKMLVKEHLRPGTKCDYIAKVIDKADYLECDIEVFIVFREMMAYRKRLQAVENIWSGMMECSQSIGTIYEMTHNLNREHLWPLCQIVDKMLMLLMGDDYDKTFRDEELYEYGFPEISDEQLHKMEIEEW